MTPSPKLLHFPTRPTPARLTPVVIAKLNRLRFIGDAPAARAFQLCFDEGHDPAALERLLDNYTRYAMRRHGGAR